MTATIKERSFLALLLFGVLTFGIYPIVYWTKISNDVNTLCEGDGQKTMKYVFVWLLNFVTLGIFGLVWKFKIAQRLKDNAPRYNIKFSESGALVLLFTLLIPVVGSFIGMYIIVKNFNAMGVAFNEYNGLVDETAQEYVFTDAE